MSARSELRIESLGQSNYLLTAETTLPRPRDEVFAFFSDAGNLEKMTPPLLRFEILTPLPIQMRVGTKIDYRIRLHGIPLRWRTNICLWQPNRRFADEQIRGPYRRWHHEHIFSDCVSDDGQPATMMTDLVHYSVPLGRFIHPLLVGPDLMNIFQYRCRRIQELMRPAAPAGHAPRSWELPVADSGVCNPAATP